MNANIYVSETADQMFNQAPEGSIAALTMQIVDELVYQHRQHGPNPGRIMYVGEPEQGVFEVINTELRGMIPEMQGTLYRGDSEVTRNNTFSIRADRFRKDAEEGGIYRDGLLVFAPTEDIAQRCEGTLEELGYNVQRLPREF